ncbi:MAG: fibronectin type III domain-containing protein [Candidatus Liptonbacteria bacterium]|nr:fibronectin type III domain-containing protein [Candidatus Liptonbacteria bacterium]
MPSDFLKKLLSQFILKKFRRCKFNLFRALVLLFFVYGGIFYGVPDAHAIVETFNSSVTWTAPAGVTSVTVEAWGGGGAGGVSGAGGTGAGGGAYSKATVTVTPGQNYSLTVGAGGVVLGTPSGDSWFSPGAVGEATVLAKGGGVAEPGTGGAAASGIGATKFSGGNGGAGFTGSGTRGGGGGGSATGSANGGNGGNGASFVAGTGGIGEGNGGGGGGTGGGGAAGPGNAPGGGGGGAALAVNGGAGAAGRVVLTYTVSVTVPTVTTQAASSIAATTATGNGNITATGGANADSRGFVYSTTSHALPGNVPTYSSGYESVVITAGDFGTGAFTATLNSMNAATTYYTRAYAHNSAGYSYGGEVSFTTLANLPTVTTQAVSSITATTATGNGNITATGGANADTRGFVYDTASRALPGNVAPGSSGYASSASDAGAFGAGAYTKGLTGLTGSTTYYTRAYAHNSAGYSYGGEVSFTTLDASPPTPNPMTFSSAPAAASTSSISMTATTGSDSTTPVNYLFTFNTCSSNGGTGGASSNWQTSTSYTNSNLQANKCYAYQVQARDSVSPTPNTGTASASSSIYTLANTPGTATFSLTTTSTLNFTNAENGNPASSPTTQFAVFTSSTSPSDPNWQGFWVTSVGATSTAAVWMSDATLDTLQIKNLQSNATYAFKVKSRNQDLIETALNAAGSGMTVPGTPGTPAYENVSAVSLTVNWAAPAGGATSYKVERATSSQVFAQIASGITNTSTNDSGLAPGTTYYYRIRATNASGDGPYSASSSVTTSAASSPPNPPSQDSPANDSQNLSVLPVFKMTATDINSDNLQYKVTIYSNSACTAVFQTNDQSVSQTGWSGQNATCVSANDCYASGAQGTYTAQNALSQNTTYYWKASAKDPAGFNTFTDSGTCNGFTTTSGAFTTDSGSWSVSASRLAVTPASGSSAQIHVAGQNRTNGVIEFKMKASAVGASAGKNGGVLRADSGANKYHIAGGDFQNGAELIGKTISSSYGTIISSAFTFAADTFYQFRGYISGTSLQSWVNGGAALSTADFSLSEAGFLGLAASSAAGGVTMTYDNFAFYSSPIITLNGLPAGGSWAVRNSAGTVISCGTLSTLDISAYSGQVPVDYDSGGGSVAVWAGNSTCAGTPTATYPSSNLAADIFGGDVYSYNPLASNNGTVVATSTITINAVGLVQ